jgi:catechol 2,3-dioxygenase-like lactoylglutathione lyase family enzyme
LIQLDGIHHISATTADAVGSVDFYTRLLGLRLAKKTVNQDEPTAYHLLFGDEAGSPALSLQESQSSVVKRGVRMRQATIEPTATRRSEHDARPRLLRSVLATREARGGR